MDAQLFAENFSRSEPAMLSAARRVGAVLLPVRAGELDLAWSCDGMIALGSQPRSGCVRAQSEAEHTVRIRDPEGRARMAVLVQSRDFRYARLARRERTLFVLVPRVMRRRIDERTECACTSGSWGREHSASGFVIDEMLIDTVVQVEVPMIEDFIEWKCKVRYV